MCRVLRVQRSGYYAWKAAPKSARTLADESLMADIRKSFENSHGIYGSPRVHCDLREAGNAHAERACHGEERRHRPGIRLFAYKLSKMYGYTAGCRAGKDVLDIRELYEHNRRC